MTLLLNYFLLSLIMFFLTTRVRRELAILSLVPFGFFVLNNFADYSQSNIILIFLAVVFPIRSMFMTRNSNNSTQLVQLAMLWFILMPNYITVITELIVFVIGLRLLVLAIGDESILSSNKLLKFESNYAVLTLLIGMILAILMFIVRGDLNLDVTLSMTSLSFVISSVGLIFLLLQLNAFGSFTVIREKLSKLNRWDSIYYKFINFVLIPFLILPLFKKILNIEVLNQQMYFVILLVCLILLVNIIELNRRKFFVGSYHLANLNLIAVSTIIIFKPSYLEHIYALFLLINFIIHTFIKEIKLSWFKKHSYSLLLLPLLYLVATNQSSIIINEQMNLWGNLIFSLFIFFPLIFINKYRNFE